MLSLLHFSDTIDVEIIENSNPFLAIVLLSRDWMKSCSTKGTLLSATKIFNIFFQKRVVYRLVHSQYENLNILECEK